ncbi:cuticle protein 10.9 [Trichonephila clavata]|uniref:Cuticle protein 10.9 n=1 Tax=Trichonephila clavata TaxID=2740835 RepID=A0A8X6GLM3_TRICU|nr:cuticle protein 10.9 [Trichonephila clavata]
MFRVIVFLGLSLLVNSQSLLLAARNNNDELSSPTPYQFSYSAPAIGGGSTHEESGDAFGRKTGSYTVQNEDGSQRIVQYVADEDGFRASISTNEPGTANQNPADVTIASSADDGLQTLTAPAAAVIPVAPAVPVAPARVIPPAQAIPTRQFRRNFNRPAQPLLVPIQPAVVPIDNGRYINQPYLLPFGGSRLIPQGLPIAGDQTVLIPINDGYGSSPLFPFSDIQPNIIIQPL